MRAALAQSVERRLGKAEVGGSIPLGSLSDNIKESPKTLCFRGFFGKNCTEKIILVIKREV